MNTDSPSLADVVERLFADFESEVGLPVVAAVARRARRDLDIVAAPALPELVERLARQRLQDLVADVTAMRRRCGEPAPNRRRHGCGGRSAG